MIKTLKNIKTLNFLIGDLVFITLSPITLKGLW